MKRLTIYYFSGTGNARKVASWIAEKACEADYAVNIKNLAEIDRKNIIKPEKDEMIGFISPTHGFNFPPVMMYFIFRYPKTGKANKVFIMNTRGSLKFGRVFVPGLSGLALWLSWIVLKIKGYRTAGLQSVDMPSNWISLHPGLSDKSIVSINDKGKRTVTRFADNILKNKTDLHALHTIAFDIIISPITILYFMFGRFLFAKTFFANSKCSRCGICVNRCAVKAIRYVGGRPFWTFKCESCMQCMNICPERAVETGHGYIAGIIYLASIFSTGIFRHFISRYFVDSEQNALFIILRYIIDTVIFFLFLFIGYRVIHYLKRVIIFRQIIEFSSLTIYKFWKRFRYNLNKK